MDPCVAKSEAEWWAMREIEKLRGQNLRMKSVLYACHHTLVAHGHIDADTDLHERISNEA